MLTNDQKKAIETMAARFRKGEGPTPAEAEATTSRLAKLASRKQSPPPQPARTIAPEPRDEPASEVAASDEADAAAGDEQVQQPAGTTAAVETPAPQEPAPQPAPARCAPRPADPAEDQQWARDNLRWRGDRPMLDLANVLRVLERHDDFRGRFTYNTNLSKVLDRGTVMVEWRMIDLCSIIQERFLPEICETTVVKALTAHANRVSAK